MRFAAKRVAKGLLSAKLSVMTLTIALDADLGQRLAQQASHEGVELAEYARRLIEQNLPPAAPSAPDTTTLELLERWEAENATSDPQELVQREKEGEEFMRSLARSRVEMEGPNARKLWP